jgi:hypothetical protein
MIDLLGRWMIREANRRGLQFRGAAKTFHDGKALDLRRRGGSRPFLSCKKSSENQAVA